MRVLVTGVTGSIGARLAERLREGGHEVVGLSRDPAKARAKVPALHDAHAWAGDDEVPPAEALRGVEAVVHLAGEPVAGRWTADKRARIERSRVEGTARVVEAIEAADPRPRVLVSASAIGFYGDRGETIVDEDTERGEGFLADVCAGWEAAARRAEALGVRVVHTRFGLVLATDGGALAAMKPLFAMGLGGRIASGRQWWPWIHVEDAVRLLRFALERDDVSGPLNGVAPAPVRQAEFAATLARVLRRPAFVPAPGFAVRAAIGGFADEVLQSRRVVPTRTLAAGFTHAHPDLEAALADLLKGGELSG